MNLSESYNFNAPQYVDFESPDDLNNSEFGEDYFDMNHEKINCKENHEEIQNSNVDTTTKLVDTVERNMIEENIVLRDIKQICLDNNVYENEQINKVEINGQCDNEQVKLDKHSPFSCEDDENKENCDLPLRRSMSLGNLHIQLNEQEIKNVITKKAGFRATVSSMKIIQNRFKSRSKETLNGSDKVGNVSCIKNRSLQLGSKNNLLTPHILQTKSSAGETGPKKFESLAERINKYQFRTPDRFHTKPKNTQLVNIASKMLVPTIPHSPMLTTKSRIRPVYYTSREEQEKIEAENMKKSQLKALPLNHKILVQPSKITIEKKEPTKPQPFDLTDYKIKKDQSHQPIIKQSIVPKPNTKIIKLTKPDESIIVNELNEKLTDNTINVTEGVPFQEGVPCSNKKNYATESKLFSADFEQRYTKYFEAKEKQKTDRLKQMMEEERKKREFHAKPIPKKVACCGPVESKLFQRRIFRSNDNINLDEIRFKARPATVVHKKPFVPKKEDHQIEICEFSLSSDERAKKREEYEKEKKEKEKEIEMLKKQLDEELEKQDAICNAQERRNRVHKANPIRHYRAIEISHSDKKLTSPKSPNFAKRKNEIKK